MKTMTCSQMGGPCDASMTVSTEKELMDAGWAHMEEAHPDMAKDVAAMSQEDKDKWAAELHAKWEAAPEDEVEEEDSAPEVAGEEEEAV